MSKFEFSHHARDMLLERKIAEEWVWHTIHSGAFIQGDDGNHHYTAPIPEKENRVLRVVVNPHVDPQRIVTLFFDRRLRQKVNP